MRCDPAFRMIWIEGYTAKKNNLPAAVCPYDQAQLVFHWLQGYTDAELDQQ